MQGRMIEKPWCRSLIIQEDKYVEKEYVKDIDEKRAINQNLEDTI